MPQKCTTSSYLARKLQVDVLHVCLCVCVCVVAWVSWSHESRNSALVLADITDVALPLPNPPPRAAPTLVRLVCRPRGCDTMRKQKAEGRCQCHGPWRKPHLRDAYEGEIAPVLTSWPLAATTVTATAATKGTGNNVLPKTIAAYTVICGHGPVSTPRHLLVWHEHHPPNAQRDGETRHNILVGAHIGQGWSGFVFKGLSAPKGRSKVFVGNDIPGHEPLSERVSTPPA